MKILLACNLGMSTSLLVEKITEEAKKKNIDAEVDAVPFDKVALSVNQTDILLLGPQVRYLVNKFKDQFGDKIPVIEAMNMSDYALLKADNILRDAMDLYNKKK